MSQKVNTTKTMGAKQVTDKELNAQIDKAKEAFGKEKMEAVSIPKLLEKNIGPSLPLVINGVRIVLPVDGTKVEVPAPYAKLLEEYLKNLKN